MKALLQNFKTGEMTIENVPSPALRKEGVLVKNIASLVSAGTEKAIIELAKMNLLEKAIARPDLVKKVLEKSGQDGLLATASIVKNLISAPLPLGYSSSGIIEKVGSKVGDLKPKQKVACAGIGYANHAEMVYVPRNLIVPVPDDLSYEEAAFVTIGSIALQGFRQSQLLLGEKVVVLGLGLVGNITAQICKAAGCAVFGLDIDQTKVKLAKSVGINNSFLISNEIVQKIQKLTNNIGVDAVIITAATKSSEPIKLAPKLLRDRGKVVALGDIGHDIPRREYYEKEIDLRQSRSYGPGRYDIQYEEKGNDYPIGYVRWTENRNMETFIKMVSEGKVNVKSLISHRYKFDDAINGYELLSGSTNQKYTGIIINYSLKRKSKIEKVSIKNKGFQKEKSIKVGLLGAGQFAQGILLPALKSTQKVNFEGVATISGLTSLNVAKKYKAKFCTSDYKDLINNEKINLVFITTRHDTHAQFIEESLNANKNCYVEKPLALNEKELKKVIKAYKDNESILMVGFNRRFSPYAKKLKDNFSGSKLIMNYRINAGFISKEKWQQSHEEGGGRIVGEICHFVDLLQFVCGSKPISVRTSVIDDNSSEYDPDNLIILIDFLNGSSASIIYTSSGSNKYSKERIEVFGDKKVGIIDSWQSLKIIGDGLNIQDKSLLSSEKGFKEEMQTLLNGIKKGFSPIPFEEIISTTRTTFAIQESIKYGTKIEINNNL